MVKGKKTNAILRVLSHLEQGKGTRGQAAWERRGGPLVGIGQAAHETVNLQQCEPIEDSPDSNLSRVISVGLGHCIERTMKKRRSQQPPCVRPSTWYGGEGTRGQAAWERRGGPLMGIGQVAHETVNPQQCEPIEDSPDSNLSRVISIGLGLCLLPLLNARAMRLHLFLGTVA